MKGHKKPTAIVKAFASTCLIFALSAGAPSRGGPDDRRPAAQPRSRSRPPLVREARRVGRARSKLVESVRATGRGGRRPWNWIGSGQRLRAPGVFGRAGRDLFEHFFRKLPGRLFLYPELVIRGIERSSPLADHKDHRILGYAAIFRDGSEQVTARRGSHNSRLSLYAVWRAPALSRGRDRAELPICSSGRF